MLIQTSVQLQTKTETIIDEAQGSLYKVSVVISCSDDTSVRLENPLISELVIEQSYVKKFVDDISLTIQIHPKDYVKLVRHHQNLNAILTFTRIDAQTNEEDMSTAPKMYKYKCLIKNSEDLEKKYNKNLFDPDDDLPQYEGQHSTRVDVFLQLLEEKMYILKNKQFNVIYSEETVGNAIIHLAAALGITKLNMVTPDNTNVYQHITIPPGKSMSNVFDFIQEQYGVYAKGLEYYYTQGVLYIYPPYDTDPQNTVTFNVYNLPANQYAGLQSYHTVRGGNFHIISNTKVFTKNLLEVGMENAGNSRSFVRADSLMSDFREVSNSMGTQVKDDNVISCELNTTSGIVKDAFISKYSRPTNNIFHQASKLARYNATMVLLGWVHSTWFDIKPGQRVIYHYDDDGKYSTRTGICEQVQYTFSRVNRLEQDYYFDCNAVMVLRLDPS